MNTIISNDGMPAKNTFNYWFARFFSNVFHPFFIPTISTIFLFFAFPFRFAEYEVKTVYMVIGLVFAITVIYPVIAILVMYKMNMIDSMNLRKRKDRIIPYVVTLTFYIWICYMALKPSNNNTLFPNDFIFSHMMLAMTLAISIAFVANNFLKVSMHMLGQGGFIGFMIFTAKYTSYDIQLLFIAAVFIAGCVGTSRMILKAHTLQEIIAGFFIALGAEYICFVILPSWGIFS
jgi:membrane-associated phospholipid phosphatase